MNIPYSLKAGPYKSALIAAPRLLLRPGAAIEERRNRRKKEPYTTRLKAEFKKRAF